MRISPLQPGTVNIDRKSALCFRRPSEVPIGAQRGARLGQAESKGTS